MAAIFDFPLIRTLDSLRSSLIVLSDLENMDILIAVKMSLHIVDTTRNIHTKFLHLFGDLHFVGHQSGMLSTSR
jgi:hypothetical protein